MKYFSFLCQFLYLITHNKPIQKQITLLKKQNLRIICLTYFKVSKFKDEHFKIILNYLVNSNIYLVNVSLLICKLMFKVI